MKWNEWSNNDALAFEYTPNFNENDGGFLVDPNSSFGSFAVGIGRGESRNLSTFARPTAGRLAPLRLRAEHGGAGGRTGRPLRGRQSGRIHARSRAAPAPATSPTSTLSFMSRAGTVLNGAGSLDDVAIFGAPLSAATIAGHYQAATPNKAPTAVVHRLAEPGQHQRHGHLQRGGVERRRRDDRQVRMGPRRQRHLRDHTTTPSTTATYATAGERTVGLRVTDDRGATGTTTSTVTVKNQPPTASFTATPSTAPTGSAIALDASASSDPDGAIAKYEWDLDGNGTYETSTGTTPTASTSFATAGSRAIGLRVTDNGGATATTTRTVTIQNRAPVAAFTATPNPAAAGQVVSFNASGSSDPDGTIAKYEWDLDGNGTFETSTGTTPTASTDLRDPRRTRRRPAGDRQRRRHTTATKAVTIANQPPTASFTATPSSAPTGTSVAFNASASKDPDGTIAKYEWDLDGNGTYETTTTTPTTSTTYATPGARTVGLRVTDNSGGDRDHDGRGDGDEPGADRLLHRHPEPGADRHRVTYNAAASSDPDGTIAKYEWDLDGNGTYETNTGATPSATRATRRPAPGTSASASPTTPARPRTTTVSVTVQNRAADRLLHRHPEPGHRGHLGRLQRRRIQRP